MLPTLRADQHRPRTRGRAAEQIQHRGSRASGDRAPAARPPFVPQTAGFKGQNAWPTASRMANASETPLPPTPPPLSVYLVGLRSLSSPLANRSRGCAHARFETKRVAGKSR